MNLNIFAINQDNSNDNNMLVNGEKNPFLSFFPQLMKTRDSNEGPGMTNKMGNDQYCLKWNSYEANLLTTFEGLLDSEALSDVTLFCEGESFKAHRLVLAACSAHFSKLFSNSTLNGQLIVILEGTHHQDLQILLQFMYKGVAYLHQDRIESVLRTAEVLQVKGLSDGGVDGINRSSRDGVPRPSSRAWTPPPQTIEAGIKRDIEPPLGPRSTSPKPSGRIAMPDSQLPQNSMPPPFFPSPYRFGLHRPESAVMKQSSTSATIFTAPMAGPGHVSRGKADLPSPGSRDSSSGYQHKFSPGREREREDYEPSSRSKEFDLAKSPNGDTRDRSPHSGISRPSSSDQFDLKPRQMTSDSTTEKVSSPGGPRRFPEEDADRNGGRRSQDHVKTERCVSPGSEGRNRSFSGDFTRETLSRLSTSSAGARSDSIIGPSAAQDLRTTDHERVDIQNLARIDALKRIAETNAARFGAANNLSSLQNSLRDSFIAGGPNFNNIPLTAPLGIPASDLARIAVQVPDPACNGTATSGTGTKLKCPFCERTYGYETNLRAHIRQRHQGIRVPCPYCHRSFTRNNTVRRHIAREHRHVVNPKMIPAKFGSKVVLPDQPYTEQLNLTSEHLNNLSQANNIQP